MNRIMVELGSVSEETRGWPAGYWIDCLAVGGKWLSYVFAQLD